MKDHENDALLLQNRKSVSQRLCWKDSAIPKSCPMSFSRQRFQDSDCIFQIRHVICMDRIVVWAEVSKVDFLINKNIHLRKLTFFPKMGQFKRNTCVFQAVFFGGHVSFRGSIQRGFSPSCHEAWQQTASWPFSISYSPWRKHRSCGKWCDWKCEKHMLKYHQIQRCSMLTWLVLEQVIAEKNTSWGFVLLQTK